MTEFYVKVETGCKEFKFEEGSIDKVYLTEPAENNRANTELIRELTELLKVKPAIISGHHSKRKKLKADISKEEMEEKFSQN